MDAFFNAMPTSLNDFETLMINYIVNCMKKTKSSFRSLVETLIRRTGHIFDNDFKEVKIIIIIIIIIILYNLFYII